MCNTSLTRNCLSIEDSNALKGIALMLLLIHHLFGITSTVGWYNDSLIGSHGIANEIGKACKLCVAIFVFLSGYGLTIQAENRGGIGNIPKFYKHRLMKLMINYWFIWLIFVPIGVLVFGRTFDGAYQDHILIKAIADVLGLAFAFGYFGYNATWWFMSCIIIYYIGFPVLYKLIKNYQFGTVITIIAIAMLPLPIIQWEIVRYSLPFLLGICMAIRGVPKVGGGNFCLIVLLFATFLLFVQRLMVDRPIIIDCLICVTLPIIWLAIPKMTWLSLPLSFLGRHSMNIFLFHTFIFSHWFKNLIFMPRNPILIFLLLLCVCLAISMFIEQLKKMLFVNRLIKSI